LLQGFLTKLLNIRAEGFVNSKLKGESTPIFHVKKKNNYSLDLFHNSNKKSQIITDTLFFQTFIFIRIEL